MVITSIKPPDELYTKAVHYGPQRPTLEGYRLLLETTAFLGYMKNSVLVAACTCALALILTHSTFAVPFSTWMLTGFFNAIPRDLDEAATIDGCNRLQAFRYVLLPLAAPGVAAALTYIFIYSWNEFIYALTFTADLRARTLPVGLQTFMGEYIIRWDLLTAGGVITSLPIVLFFMLVQRRLIGGLTAGAVKG
jgi:multiple sugar transport system permease protein